MGTRRLALLALVAAILPSVYAPWRAPMPPAAASANIAASSAETASSLNGTVSSIAAGFDHTCAILRNGTVRCWGNNSLGQLGLGNTNDVGRTSDTLPDSVPPVDLGPGRTALQISAGYDTTCVLLDTHQVLCWGSGAGGALGHGDGREIGDNETPGSVGPIDLGENHTAVAIAAGASYSCAILDDASVKCWGSGSYGELGYGNTTAVFDPSTVGPVSLGSGRTAVAIAATADHTCVIVNTGGVMCWGMNLVGALGYGYNETVNQNIGDDETPDSVGTIDLGGHTALQVTGGDHQTCAILDDHTLRCWGASYRGMNGYPGGYDYYSPPTAPVDLGPGRTVLSVEGGADHACAVLDDHSVRCWGFGDDGRLGYGNTNDVGDNETPGSAGPVNLGPGRTADAVSAGRWHSCALMDTGEVRCWGEGSLLGYGNATSIGDNETPDTAGPVSLNHVPTAADDTFATSAGTTLAVPAPGVLANDADVNGDNLSATLAAGPTSGTLTLNTDGSFTYTPQPSFAGTDTFTYRVSDGLADSDPATVTLRVNPVLFNANPSGSFNSMSMSKAVSLVPSKTNPCSKNYGSACTTPSTIVMSSQNFAGPADASATLGLCNMAVFAAPNTDGSGGEGDVAHGCDYSNALGFGPGVPNSGTLHFTAAGDCCAEATSLSLQLPSSSTLTQSGGPVGVNTNAGALCPPTPTQISKGFTCSVALARLSTSSPPSYAGYRQVFLKSPIPSITCNGGPCPSSIPTGTTVSVTGVQFPCRTIQPDDPSTPAYDGTCTQAHTDKKILIKRVSNGVLVPGAVTPTSQTANVNGDYTITFTMPGVPAAGETYKIIPHAQSCSFPCESGNFNAAGKFVRHA